MGGGRGGGTVMLQRELQCVSFFSCDKKQVCGPFSFFLFTSTRSMPCSENG